MEAIHRGDAFGYSKASLVIESQLELDMFVLSMAASILHDRSPSATWVSYRRPQDEFHSDADDDVILEFQRQISQDYVSAPERR